MSEVLDAPAPDTTDLPEPEPIEAAATESTTDVVVHRPSAPAPSRQVLMPLDAEQVVESMAAYQALLPRLLDQSDYQGTGSDRFVKKSGWRKIARAFNLSVELVSVHVERDAEGQPTRAEAIARAIAPNGQVQDGDGYCSADEKRFVDPRGRQKLENDLRATATTRAKNRAIADLVGMGEVSAEEAEVGGRPSIERGSDEEIAKAKRALGALVGEEAAFAIWTEAVNGFGGIAAAPFVRAVLAIKASETP